MQHTTTFLLFDARSIEKNMQEETQLSLKTELSLTNCATNLCNIQWRG